MTHASNSNTAPSFDEFEVPAGLCKSRGAAPFDGDAPTRTPTPTSGLDELLSDEESEWDDGEEIAERSPATRCADDPALFEAESCGEARFDEPTKRAKVNRKLPSVAKLRRERDAEQKARAARCDGSVFEVVQMRRVHSEEKVTGWASGIWAGAASLVLRRRAAEPQTAQPKPPVAPPKRKPFTSGPRARLFA